jgi:hypothetical protein
MQHRPQRRPGSRIKPFLLAAYDNVHMALWATLIAGLIYMGMFGVPSMLAAQSANEAHRILAIEAEDALYCGRWGMGIGSSKHAACMSDLKRFRHSVEKQIADDSFF